MNDLETLDSFKFEKKYEKYNFEDEYDWKVLLYLLSTNPLALQFVDSRFRASEKFMSQAVRKNSNTLKFGTSEIQDNDKIVMEAILNDPRAFAFASPRLRKSKKFLEIIEIFNNKDYFKNATNSMKNNEKVVFLLMDKYPENYKYIGKELKKNSKIAFAAITKMPENLKYADSSLQRDKKFILKLMNSKCDNLEKAYPFVGDNLKKDADFVLDRLKESKYRSFVLPKKVFFYYADESLKKDKDFLFKAALIAPEAIFNQFKELADDYYFILNLMDNSYTNIEFASDSLKDNDEFITDAIKINPECFKYASLRLKNNENYILKHINETPEILMYCSELLKNNTDFISKIKKININYLKYFKNETILNDDMISEMNNNSADATAIKKLIENIISSAPRKVLLLSEKTRDDEDYMLSLISTNGAVLSYVSDRLKEDINFNIRVLTKYPKYICYASEYIKRNYDVNIAILKERKSNFKYLDNYLKFDVFFILKACLECDNNIIKNIDYNTRNQVLDILTRENKLNQVLVDDNFVYDLLRKDRYSFGHLSDEMRDNEDYALFAIKRANLNYKYASDRLRNDIDFAKKILSSIGNGGICEYFTEKLKDNEELMLTCIYRSNASYSRLSPRLKKDPEYNALLFYRTRGSIEKYLSKDIITNPIFLRRLKDNGIDVSKYEAILDEKKDEISKQERKYLEICKKFIEEKKLNPKLTKKEFSDNENISPLDFDDALNYIKDVDLTLYEYIKNSLKMNSQRYMRKKEQIIDQFFNDLKNGINLSNGEIRDCNVIDFYNYFGNFGINCNMKSFKEFINQSLDSDSVRALRKFFELNKRSSIDYTQEYNGKQVYMVDGKQVEATLEQKKYIVHLMAKNNLPHDRRIYSLLLRALVKGRLELEYGYLLDNENIDTNENGDNTEKQDKLIEIVNQLIEAQANSTYTEDTTGSVKH